MSAATKKSKKPSAPKPVVIKPDSLEVKKPSDKPETAAKPALKVRDFRMLKVGLILLGIFLAFCVLCALIFNSTNNSKLDKYKDSKEFSEFSKSLQSYLDANKSIYPKAYTCQLNSSQLWSPPINPLSKKRDAMDVQLARQLIDLKPKWEAVSKTFPGYSSFFIFKVLPFDHSVYKKYQNAADLMDRTSALVNHTEDYTYYCPGFVYPGIADLVFLDAYSKPGLIKDSPSVITARLQAVANVNNTYKAAKTTKEWSAARKAYLSFLHKTFGDLTKLRDESVKHKEGVNMAAAFIEDKKELEKALSEAAKAGKSIGPDQAQLAKLAKEVIPKN